MAKEKHVLFVCKHNVFRSKVAEAFFKKFAQLPFVARSAGVFPGRKLDLREVAAAQELGVLLKGKPRGIDQKLLDWQDFIVIVANDVPRKIFTKEKRANVIYFWNIPDISAGSKKEIQRIILAIEEKVKAFTEVLEHG